MIIRHAILGALCGAMTALGAATVVIALSSTPAAAAEKCFNHHRPYTKLYCNTKNSPPVQRKVDGTIDKFNHPRITKRY